MKVFALILAGGSGSRFGGSLPKQLLNLHGRPLFVHSLLTFAAWSRCAGIVVTARKDLMHTMQSVGAGALKDVGADPGLLRVVEGADSRHGSAVEAARAVADRVSTGDIVFFHDAARPFLSEPELERLADCFLTGSCQVASLAGPVHETVVTGTLPGDFGEPVDRGQLVAVKTPQALAVDRLGDFLTTPEHHDLTDLLTWSHARNLGGRLVAADPDNRKLTLFEELALFEAIARRRASFRDS